MRWQTIHDRLFVALVVLCTGYLLVVARGAQVRERARLVQPLEAQPKTGERDEARLSSIMEDAKLGRGDGPDVVFIAIDGLRADAISALGGWTPTPALEAFAQGARVAAAVQAPSPEAAASRVSLLTGVHPIEHGVYRLRNGGWPRGDIRATLPKRLARAGWATVGISANSIEDDERHVRRGFDIAIDEKMTAAEDGLPYLRADRVTDLALSAFQTLEGGPRFLWVEYGDLQTPWVPWEPWIDNPLTLVSYAMWWPGKTKVGWNKRFANLMKKGSSVSNDTMETWRVVYSAELQLVDREIGRLLDGLGVDESDWVVLVGVNGMYLGEHSLLGDGYDVYQEGVAVPLLIRGPASLDTPAGSADVPNLLLEALGLTPLPSVEAYGLAVSEVRYAPPEVLKASYGQRFKRVRRAWLDVEAPEHLLILDSGGAEEAYDLSDGGYERLKDAPWADDLRERAGLWLIARGEGKAISEEKAPPKKGAP